MILNSCVCSTEGVSAKSSWLIKDLEKRAVVRRNETQQIMAEGKVLCNNQLQLSLVSLHHASFQTEEKLDFVHGSLNWNDLMQRQMTRWEMFNEVLPNLIRGSNHSFI